MLSAKYQVCLSGLPNIIKTWHEHSCSCLINSRSFFGVLVIIIKLKSGEQYPAIKSAAVKITLLLLSLYQWCEESFVEWEYTRSLLPTEPHDKQLVVLGNSFQPFHLFKDKSKNADFFYAISPFANWFLVLFFPR